MKMFCFSCSVVCLPCLKMDQLLMVLFIHVPVHPPALHIILVWLAMMCWSYGMVLDKSKFVDKKVGPWQDIILNQLYHVYRCYSIHFIVIIPYMMIQ